MKFPPAAKAAALILASLAGASLSVWAAASSRSQTQAQAGSIARGRYLVVISGCHDCRTPGHLMNEGHSSASDWLTGQSIGFKGPWGTTYPPNLRLTVQSMSEPQWLVFARAQRRPPMPWFNLKEMSDEDLTDIYHFIRSLGPKGSPAPNAVPPGGKVTTPYIVFEPQNLPGPQGAKARTTKTVIATPMPEVVVRAKRVVDERVALAGPDRQKRSLNE